MSDGNLLHLGSAVLMFAAALVPVYLSLRLKSNFRILTVLLAVFIFVHGIYHLSYCAGEEVLGEGLFRTISIVLFSKLTSKWLVFIFQKSHWLRSIHLLLMTTMYLKDITPNHLPFRSPFSNKNKCPEFTLGRLISERSRWVYDMNDVDSAANIVNCEWWVNVTIRHAACEITDYATNY